MPETIKRSSLKNAKKGEVVNLERAVRLDSRMGGHIVSGHIDGTGTIEFTKEDKNAVWYKIKVENNSLLKYVVEKGSIAIDGISLTVAKVRKYIL